MELGLPEIISTASGPNHEMGVSLKQLAAESHGDPNLIGMHPPTRFVIIMHFVQR